MASAALREQLIGAWELILYSAYNADDPLEVTYPLTKNAKGMLIYSSDGYMAVQLQQPGTPPFKNGDDINGGTDEELANCARHYMAYTGPFYLQCEEGKKPVLMHHMSICSYPNWLGNTQRRLVKLSVEGEHNFLNLSVEIPIVIDGKRLIPEVRWRKMKHNLMDTPPSDDIP